MNCYDNWEIWKKNKRNYVMSGGSCFVQEIEKRKINFIQRVKIRK